MGAQTSTKTCAMDEERPLYEVNRGADVDVRWEGGIRDVEEEREEEKKG